MIRDVEIFLDMPVIWTDFENLVSPNNKIWSRNINFLSVRMKFCQSNPSVWHFSTSLHDQVYKQIAQQVMIDYITGMFAGRPRQQAAQGGGRVYTDHAHGFKVSTLYTDNKQPKVVVGCIQIMRMALRLVPSIPTTRSPRWWSGVYRPCAWL